MIKDPQEYLDKWEREHNPFYPSEMRWDRVKVNRFLKDWKEQCNIANVVGQSEQLVCPICEEEKKLINNLYCQDCNNSISDGLGLTN